MAGDPSSDAASMPPSAPRRKFAVEPVETTSRSSRSERGKKQQQQQEEEEERSHHRAEDEVAKPRRRFLPQPVEETTRSSRRGGAGAGAGTEHGNKDEAGKADATAVAAGAAEKKPRKFAVEPVETVKRVRRRNTGPALQPGDATDDTPGDRVERPQHLDLPSSNGFAHPPANSPSSFDEAAVPQPPESRFSYASLARKASRQSSMRKPTLEPISSVPESEESNFSKRSSSSNSSAHEDIQHLQIPRKKRQPRQKESYEEVFSGYLLDMAARAAQQQLREQAAEAYPNERLYEPVDHFAVDRESDSDVEEALGQLPETSHEVFKDRRESNAGWDLSEFRKHKEKMRQQKQEQEKADAKRLQLPKADPARVSPAKPKKDPFGNQFNLSAIGIDAADATDPEMSRMQDQAKPPMLGYSLIFPKCQSPRVTLIDPLQRHGTRQNTGVIARKGSGLWTPDGEMSPISKHHSPKVASPRASVCLWGGNCTADQAQKIRLQFGGQIQTGIMTPQYAPDEDPFERYANDQSLQNAQVTVQLQQQQGMWGGTKSPPPSAAATARAQHQLPSNPGNKVHSILGIDQLLAIEERLEQEYPDAFVTQIYNYLSLGYPAIARRFDEELSRISKVSVEEIRREDERKNTKGYVNAPEGKGVDEATVREECGRWRALRLYIREWGRQQPNMMEDGADNNWGARARRGSWFA